MISLVSFLRTALLLPRTIRARTSAHILYLKYNLLIFFHSFLSFCYALIRDNKTNSALLWIRHTNFKNICITISCVTIKIKYKIRLRMLYFSRKPIWILLKLHHNYFKQKLISRMYCNSIVSQKMYLQVHVLPKICKLAFFLFSNTYITL